MKTLSYTQSRAQYAKMLDDVVADREETIVTRSGHDPVVIVSLEDYQSLRETAYLLRSPANARHLLDTARSTASSKNDLCVLSGTNPHGMNISGGRAMIARSSTESTNSSRMCHAMATMG